jgi:hypothetical protein
MLVVGAQRWKLLLRVLAAHQMLKGLEQLASPVRNLH